MKLRSVCCLLRARACGGGLRLRRCDAPAPRRRRRLELRARARRPRRRASARTSSGSSCATRSGAAASRAPTLEVQRAHARDGRDAARWAGRPRCRELGDGRYRADFELDMGGSWQVEIARDARRAAPRLRAEGSLTVGTPGLRLARRGRRRRQPAARERHGARPGEFRIDPERLQQIGVRIAQVERAHARSPSCARRARRRLRREHARGRLAQGARLGRRRSRSTRSATRVERGQVLFTLYSPELYAAQQELAAGAAQPGARARQRRAGARRLPGARRARTGCALWDIAPADIERARRRAASRSSSCRSARRRAATWSRRTCRRRRLRAGRSGCYRIAPLARVWVEAEIYEERISRS